MINQEIQEKQANFELFHEVDELFEDDKEDLIYAGNLNFQKEEKRPDRLFNRRKVLHELKDRVALTTNYMELRCGRFYNDYLYLDLTGKIVQERLGRRLDDEDISSVCTFLIKNKKISYLSLGYNLITEHGFSHLAHYLAENGCSLRTLNLTHNEICSIDENVLRTTAALWKLKCLLLRGNKFGPKGGLILGRLIKHNVSLVHLDVGETDQTIQSSFQIVQSLMPNLDGNTSIQKLDMSRVVPSSRSGFPHSSSLCQLIERFLLLNNTIVELHLEKNDIADWDLELMLSGLRENKVLELINLAGNRLTSHGLELLSTVLPETNIKYLMLPSNSITDDGAIALGKIFPVTKIKFLDISHNKITDIGMVNLFLGMGTQNPPVHTLFIYGNPITKESVKVLLKQACTGHILPFAIDLNFTSMKTGLHFTEDRTINIYKNVYYFAHELKAYKRPLHHSCCY